MEIEGLMVSGPGSVDRHFGHTAPKSKEHTWIVVRINRIAIILPAAVSPCRHSRRRDDAHHDARYGVRRYCR